MKNASRLVTSTQQGVHHDLIAVVKKHLATEFRKPFADYNCRAFADSMAAWGARAPLILDAGCGVGESSLQLARAYPDHFVIGVDQSADRLGRDKRALAAALPDNLVFIRADLVDYWRLLAAEEVRLARHYVLYPNPWPKPHHLLRRWHAHPVFAVWPRLGGVFEHRTNWRIYADEMAASWSVMLGQTHCAEPFTPTYPISPFERKYQASGHGLFRLALEVLASKTSA